MKRGTGSNDGAPPERHGKPMASTEWIRILPGDVLESHPVVRDLRRLLEATEAALAAKEKEIVRLQVAVEFGLKELPSERGRADRMAAP